MSINESVLNMSKKMKESVKVDSKSGVGLGVDSLYKDCLPEELNLKTCDSVHVYDRDFVAASAKVFGELSVDAMSSNKKLETSSITIPMGKGVSCSHQMAREKVWPNTLAGPDAPPIVKKGVVSSSFTTKAGKKQGDMGKIAKELAELGAKKL